MNTKFTLGQTVDLVRPSDPPVLVRSRIVGLTLDHAGTVWYNVKSVRKPEQGTLCDVPEASLRPIDDSPEHSFKVGDVVTGVPGSALFGRGQLIVRRTDRPGVWALEVEDTEGRRVPASESELARVPGTSQATGHNPDGLTLGQVGQGFRLAPEGHVGACELWVRGYGAGGYWFPMFDPRCRPLPNRTYRIKW